MDEQPVSSRRSRGVLLSDTGWQRLQTAKQQAELQTLSQQPYTLSEIGQLTGLSYNTLVKVHQREVAVDRKTLDTYFSYFGLTLQTSDYVHAILDLNLNRAPLPLGNIQGPVPLNSPFYIQQPTIKALWDGASLKPGALIRIKAPWHMGKTSSILRILHQARVSGLQTLLLSMRLADTALFNDLNRFLYWYCAIVTRDLGLPNRLEAEWDELFGANYNCTHYFERHILKEINSPIVLALDDVDILFQYPAIANDFFGLLRVWYEKAKYGDSNSNVWQKLRLVVAHSTEVYIPLNIHQSPFSVGISIQLPEFTQDQVQELAQRYGLLWCDRDAQQLIELVGGNPYLVQMALYQIRQQGIDLEQLKQQLLPPNGIYSDHLQRQLRYLQQYPELLAALMEVMTSSVPIQLELVQTFRLQSIGLVQVRDRSVVPSCELYRQYFSTVLPQSD